MTEQGKQMLEIINSFSKEWNDRRFDGFTEQEKTSTRAIWKESREMPLQERENLEND